MTKKRRKTKKESAPFDLFLATQSHDREGTAVAGGSPKMSSGALQGQAKGRRREYSVKTLNQCVPAVLCCQCAVATQPTSACLVVTRLRSSFSSDNIYFSCISSKNRVDAGQTRV